MIKNYSEQNFILDECTSISLEEYVKTAAHIAHISNCRLSRTLFMESKTVSFRLTEV